VKSFAALRITILGAGGFLGSHLVEALLRTECSIKAVDLAFDKIETRHRRLASSLATCAKKACSSASCPKATSCFPSPLCAIRPSTTRVLWK